jgi:type VI secretion system Hcp family effector
MIWDSRSEVWDRSAVGRFQADPPPDVLARYGGAQFAGGGMAGMSREAPAPRDQASGMATGRRQHAPFTIVKEVDKATPKLMEACANGAHLDVEVWERNDAGQEQLRYTLKEAIITSISVNRGEDGAAAPMESISFVFEKIEMAPDSPAARTNLNSSRSN